MRVYRSIAGLFACLYTLSTGACIVLAIQAEAAGEPVIPYVVFGVLMGFGAWLSSQGAKG